MPAFLIPIAGLALGALGKLINNRRSQSALAQATASGNAATPSETGVSTAAANVDIMATNDAANVQSQNDWGNQASQDAWEARGQGGDSPSGSSPLTTTDPATGPPQQNQTTPSNGDAGLAARLGLASAIESRRKNREQQSSLSQDAVAK